MTDEELLDLARDVSPELALIMRVNVIGGRLQAVVMDAMRAAYAAGSEAAQIASGISIKETEKRH